MNIEDAKQYLNNHAGDVLEPDGESTHKSEDAHDFGYICPLCGSGSGDKGTGMKRDPKSKTHFKCFACGFYGDIVELLSKRDGYEGQNYMTQLKHACRVFNIPLEGVRSKQTKDAPLGWDLEPIYEAEETPAATPAQTQNTPSLEGERAPKRAEPEPVRDFSGLIYEAMQHIDECDYLDRRGISKDLQKKMRIGYIERYTVPNNHAITMPAIIIPTFGNSAYTIASVNGADKEKKIAKYYNEGTKGIYNLYALHSDPRAVFVVEGEIDALSFMELGFKAIALRSASSNHDALIKEMQGIDPAQRPLLILALDNDPAGTKGTLTLSEKLQKAGIEYHLPKSSDIYGEHKDANECLVNEREAFRERLEPLNKTNEELYNENSARHALTSFLEDIEHNRNKEPISTGFFNLDDTDNLDGGLYAGLYVIGAISSLGKTTFTLQMADNIAKAGHDVLIFSLEMARRELIAKSISRISFKGMTAGQNTASLARSTRDLLSNVNRNNAEQMQVIKNALTQYAEYAENIFIVEGLGDVDIDRIKNTIAQHVIYRKKTPVVIIDYLQIIAPYEPKATDKQNTDKAVLELKRISRDYDTPVIAISSFNRDNYKEAVNMSSFKESGAIEYSSDVLLGLQLSGAGVKGVDLEELKKKTPRQVELKILKNRNGKTGGCVAFDFYPMYNDFEEV